jgi:thioredoxin reductase/NAD-dependent dihydropyrimidine dehydrogenase PreA subunit
MTEGFIAFLLPAVVMLIFVGHYLRNCRKREARAREALNYGQNFTEGPKGLHPHIDGADCIGCGACVDACPEGDVLAVLGGQAVIVNGHKCIGHGICAEVCPVGAIRMTMAAPGMDANRPYLSREYETTIDNLFIVGELGGLALIKNAINQGRDCIDTIDVRMKSWRIPRVHDAFDVVIVGAGPAGISASLRCIEKGLRYMTLERDEVGGTVAKYPRQKLVMTSPVEFPLYGKVDRLQFSKEHLLSLWDVVLNRFGVDVREGENVQSITRDENGIFTVTTAGCQYPASAVVLALGRAGEPMKLGVKGEELSKVMYRLIEANHYVNKKILVVGGGDSAVEAAMGLAHQQGNDVTLSYRRDRFLRIKERNAKRIGEIIRAGKLKVVFNSQPLEFKQDSVVLDIKGRPQEMANDFVWVFAGGRPPNDFLKQIGVGFGLQNGSRNSHKEQPIPTVCP